MANKREFKKFVAAVGNNICEDIVINSYNIAGVDMMKVNEALGRVLKAVDTACADANVTFDRGYKAFPDKHAYTLEKEKYFRALFNKINADFAEALNDAVKEFNDALPADVKASQKDL